MAVVVLVAWPENLRAQGALQPVNLRCEERVNPLGIGNTRPGLSWQLHSSGPGTAYRGETQSAFEIQVGSTAGATDLWDSGKGRQQSDLGYYICRPAIDERETMFLAGAGV